MGQLSLIFAAFSAAAFLPVAGAADRKRVVVSIQPANYAMFPAYVAQVNGYFDQMGLDVTTVVYPSGAPQVKDALENNAWDLGAAGVVPVIVGGVQGILNVGISNDESATNQLIGNSKGVQAWPLGSIKGVKFAVTPNSTGEFAVEACLESEGFNLTEIERIYGQQSEIAEIVKLADDGEEQMADYGSFWAPNTNVFLSENVGSAALCSGETAGATVTGGIMVRAGFANDNPGVVSQVLAAWLRGIAFIKNPENRDAVVHHMEEYYASFNVSITFAAMENEINTRPLYNLDEQLEIMSKSAPGDVSTPLAEKANSMSEYERSTQAVVDFLLRGGVLSSPSDPVTFITDKFMQEIFANETLRSFARMEDENTEGGDSSSSKPAFSIIPSFLITAVSLIIFPLSIL